MFALKNMFSTSNAVETDDLINVKGILNRLGYYMIPPHRGLDDWTDDATFDGLKRFQRDNGLKVDGLMRPGGPTEATMNRNLMRVSSPGGNSGNGGTIPYTPLQLRDDVAGQSQSGNAFETGTCVPPNDNFNMDRFIASLNRRAGSIPQHECAKYVRMALEAGGADTSMRLGFGEAKDYDNVLKYNGFIPIEIISEEDYGPQRGDIVIFQPYPGGNRAGHIQVWNGKEWVSDFKQPRKFWPDSRYEAAKKPFQVYRRCR